MGDYACERKSVSFSMHQSILDPGSAAKQSNGRKHEFTQSMSNVVAIIVMSWNTF